MGIPTSKQALVKQVTRAYEIHILLTNMDHLYRAISPNFREYMASDSKLFCSFLFQSIPHQLTYTHVSADISSVTSFQLATNYLFGSHFTILKVIL